MSECIHCGATEEPDHGIFVRVATDSDGAHYTVCNICEPEADDA